MEAEDEEGTIHDACSLLTTPTVGREFEVEPMEFDYGLLTLTTGGKEGQDMIHP